jgi:hypothetical protein
MLEDLKKRLREEEKSLKQKSGTHCLFSETGPISLGLAKEIIKVVEVHHQEIRRLKDWIAMRG